MNRNKLINRIGAIALSSALAISALTLNLTAGAQETDSIFTDAETKIINSIDTDFILDKIEYVHNNIGPRFAGTPADEASAEYFADVFKNLGYSQFSLATAQDGEDDYFQTISDNATVNSYIGASITIDGREYGGLAPHWSDYSVYKGYNTPTVTASTVYFESVDDAVAADPAEVAGKIVLTNKKDLSQWSRFSTAYADYARTLESNGAAALVFIHNKYTVSSSGATSRENELYQPTSGDDINIPVIQISYLDGKEILKNLTHHGQVHSTTATVVNRRNTHTSNVLAVKEAKEPSDKYVIIGGHRDSVLGAEGVDDNLSGTVNVLAIANALKDVDTEYNVVFALWAAEEEGLLGSKYFYSQFLYPDNWGKEHVVAYYNLDMSATSQTRNSVLTIHTPYRDASNKPLQSTAGDVAEKNAERYKAYVGDRFDAWWSEGPDDLVDIQYFGNCSDHASITGATGANGTTKLAFGEGIPSVYIFWGDRIGDGTNNVTEENYHVVGDIYKWPADEDVFTVTSDSAPFTGNFSIERAQILATVFALSVYDTAASPIENFDNSEVYYGDTTFNVSYNYRDNITLDGENVTVDENGQLTVSADDKEHTISLTDVFGNTAEYTFSVLKTYDVTLNLTSTLNLAKQGVEVPNETFTFELTAAADEDSQPIEKVPAIDPIVISVSSDDENVDGKVTKEVTENISAAFPETGIYKYEVKEIAGSNTNITYDNRIRTLKIKVVEGQNGQLEISNVVTYNANGEKEALDFENSYTKEAALTVSKAVEGNPQNTDKKFSYTIDFTKDEVNGDKTIAAVITDQNGNKTGENVPYSGYSFELGNGEKIEFSLPAGTLYTITEGSSRDYQPTAVIVANGETSEESARVNKGLNVSSFAGEKSNSVAFTNLYIDNPLTGIVQHNGPFILIIIGVLAAIVLFFVFDRKRRNART